MRMKMLGQSYCTGRQAYQEVLLGVCKLVSCLLTEVDDKVYRPENDSSIT